MKVELKIEGAVHLEFYKLDWDVGEDGELERFLGYKKNKEESEEILDKLKSGELVLNFRDRIVYGKDWKNINEGHYIFSINLDKSTIVEFN